MDSRCAESPSPIWSPKRRATLRGRLQLCGGALRGGNVFGDAVDAAAHPRTCPIPEAKLLREPKASLRQQLQFHEFAHRHSAVSIKTARAGRCRTTPNPSLGKRRRLPASLNRLRSRRRRSAFTWRSELPRRWRRRPTCGEWTGTSWSPWLTGRQGRSCTPCKRRPTVLLQPAEPRCARAMWSSSAWPISDGIESPESSAPVLAICQGSPPLRNMVSGRKNMNHSHSSSETSPVTILDTLVEAIVCSPKA